MVGSSSEELKECPPPSPAVLWFVNDCGRKKKKDNLILTQDKDIIAILRELGNTTRVSGVNNTT